MSAPFSTTSLATSLNLRVGAPTARNAVLGIESLGAAPDSFSRTLQNQLDAGNRANTRSEPAPTPPAREPERSRAPEGTREPERSPEPTRSASQNTEGERTDGDAGAENRGPDGQAGEASTAGRQADGPRAGEAGAKDGAQAKGGEAADQADATVAAAGTGGDAAAATLAAMAAADAQVEPDAGVAALTQAAADASAIPPTDPAALAGLPAAIAALLAGRQAPPSGDTRAEAPLLTTDGKGRALQNSALLPKTDVAVEGGGRGVFTPAFALQGRELAAAVIGARGAASGQALQALQGEPGSAANLQPGQALPAHGPAQLLRHAPATQPATPQLPVYTPAGQEAWAEDVGNQVRWMLGRAESKAELVLTPPNLGKLEVSINLNGDQTTAQFIAANQAARDALERALPQLREVLQQAGIMLGDANVSTSQQGAGGEGQEGRGRDSGRGEAGSAGELAGAGASAGVWLRQQQGMVDTFA